MKLEHDSNGTLDSYYTYLLHGSYRIRDTCLKINYTIDFKFHNRFVTNDLFDSRSLSIRVLVLYLV